MPREYRDSDGRGSLHPGHRDRRESRGQVDHAEYYRNDTVPGAYYAASSRQNESRPRSDRDEQLSRDYRGSTAQETSRNYMYTPSDAPRNRRSPANSYETNTLDELRTRFIQIEFDDYTACSQFVLDYPEVLDDDKVYVQQARTAYSRNNEGLAQRCLHRALLAGFCQQFKESDRADYIYNLPANKQHKKDFFRAYRELEARTLSQVEPSPLTAVDSNAGVDSRQRRPSIRQSASASAVADWSDVQELPAIDEMNIHDQRDYMPAQADGEEAYLPTESSTNTRHRRSLDRQHSSSYHPKSRSSMQTSRDYGSGSRPGPSTLIQPYPSKNRVPSAVSNKSTLHSGFKVRAPDFFVFGRVCKVVWHSPAGNDVHGNINDSNCTIGIYNEPIYSSLRWMLVIMPKSGHCICCPISTYNGKGLGAKNLTDQDVRAHAIVYADGGSPVQFSGEPSMAKDPIPIVLSGRKPDIHPASRVHFGKVHTLEYNWKVMDVGVVHSNSLPYIQAYVQQELGINLA